MYTQESVQGACAVQLEFDLWRWLSGCQLRLSTHQMRCGSPLAPLAAGLAAAVRADGARPRGVGISSIWRGVVVVEDMGHCA